MPKFEVQLSVVENGRRRPESTLDTDLNGEMTLKDILAWTKTTLIVTSDEVLREEQARGFDEKPLLIVDNRPGKDIRNVNPLGQIEFVSRADFGDILTEAYLGILNRSKVLTGTYIRSHYIFYNGSQIASDLGSLSSWLEASPNFKNGDTIRIVNIQPYARRLELLGVTAQRTQNKREDSGRRNKKKTGTLIKIPNGTYQLTYRSIKAKYKRNVNIRFTFLPGSSLGIVGSFKAGRAGRNSAGRPYLYPTLVFTISERGII